VLDTLRAKRFCDQSPVEVYATLLEEDRYLCAPRTMYRILADSKEVRERRNQLRHPRYHRPLLLPLRDARPVQPLRGGLAVGDE
jgi:putative transposase